MYKSISKIVRTSILILIAACFVHDLAEAGTYTLKYPKGYGTNCTPKSDSFGYYTTGWREFPGEVRLDKTFSKSINMEVVPTPAPQEIIKTPKAEPIGAKKSTEKEGEGTEKSPTESGLPSEMLPGGEGSENKPTEPGSEMPGLPSEQGFNPLPSLPPDVSPAKSDTPEELKPGDDVKPKTDSKNDLQDILPGESTEKPNDGVKLRMPPSAPKLSRMSPMERTLKAANPKADLQAMSKSYSEQVHAPEVSQPNVTGSLVRSDTIAPPANIVSNAVHQERMESASHPKITRDIAAQLYQPEKNAEPEPSAVVQTEYKADAPLVCLGGFCPVTLLHNGSWVQGDTRWTVVYKGEVYRLSGEVQKREFLANPDKYVPANNGCDLVFSVIQKQNKPGQVNYCAAYKGRIYMFCSAATQEEFYRSPDMYTGTQSK